MVLMINLQTWVRGSEVVTGRGCEGLDSHVSLVGQQDRRSCSVMVVGRAKGIEVLVLL
jgi:hypothetical protein